MKAILFDFDGTIVDLDVDWESLTRKINNEFFDGKYNHLSPHEFFKLYFNVLYDDIPDEKRRKIHELRLSVELEGAKRATLFIKKETIEQLSLRFRLGVVSGNLRKPIEFALERFGIKHFFDVLVSVDDSIRTKPSPEPLRIALEKLNCKPNDAIYVGNHLDDMICAKRVGMYAVGVAKKFSEEELIKAGADDVISDINDILMSHLIEEFLRK